jgi:hypothetical protein
MEDNIRASGVQSLAASLPLAGQSVFQQISISQLFNESTNATPSVKPIRKSWI